MGLIAHSESRTHDLLVHLWLPQTPRINVVSCGQQNYLQRSDLAKVFIVVSCPSSNFTIFSSKDYQNKLLKHLLIQCHWECFLMTLYISQCKSRQTETRKNSFFLKNKFRRNSNKMQYESWTLWQLFRFLFHR